ncbi:hypothetical protein [Rodentibacter abscessus]
MRYYYATAFRGFVVSDSIQIPAYRQVDGIVPQVSPMQYQNGSGNRWGH